VTEGLTKISGVPDRSQAISGMAHFSGTGPNGTKCAACKKFSASEVRNGKSRCKKYSELTGRVGSLIRGDNSSCRYFEKKDA
jgi:hypothetical protein